MIGAEKKGTAATNKIKAATTSYMSRVPTPMNLLENSLAF